VTDTLEPTAKRIADRGRDALLARLRPAFADAASAHAEIMQLDDEQLERMVQRAADRADGLQWRRALAMVASEELGIGLGEALGHPAVERAQAIVGAPSYEDSLAALEAGPDAPVALDRRAKMGPPTQAEPMPAQAEPAPAQPEPRVRRIEREPQQPEPTVRRIEREPQQPEPTVRRIERKPVRPESEITRVERQPTAPEGRSTEDTRAEEPAPKPASAAAQAGPRPTAAQARPAPRRLAPTARSAEPEGLRVAAIHLGGVTNLKPGESEIELRLSEHGLDIARQSGEVIGRLGWDEIEGIEVPPPRGFMWRRRAPRSHLVVRAGHGDASFEIPSVYPDELSEHLEPVLQHYGRGLAPR